jgi:hypothetical protein
MLPVAQEDEVETIRSGGSPNDAVMLPSLNTGGSMIMVQTKGGRDREPQEWISLQQTYWYKLICWSSSSSITSLQVYFGQSKHWNDETLRESMRIPIYQMVAPLTIAPVIPDHSVASITEVPSPGRHRIIFCLSVVNSVSFVCSFALIDRRASMSSDPNSDRSHHSEASSSTASVVASPVSYESPSSIDASPFSPNSSIVDHPSSSSSSSSPIPSTMDDIWNHLAFVFALRWGVTITSSEHLASIRLQVQSQLTGNDPNLMAAVAAAAQQALVLTATSTTQQQQQQQQFLDQAPSAHVADPQMLVAPSAPSSMATLTNSNSNTNTVSTAQVDHHGMSPAPELFDTDPLGNGVGHHSTSGSGMVPMITVPTGGTGSNSNSGSGMISNMMMMDQSSYHQTSSSSSSRVLKQEHAFFTHNSNSGNGLYHNQLPHRDSFGDINHHSTSSSSTSNHSRHHSHSGPVSMDARPDEVTTSSFSASPSLLLSSSAAPFMSSTASAPVTEMDASSLAASNRMPRHAPSTTAGVSASPAVRQKLSALPPASAEAALDKLKADYGCYMNAADTPTSFAAYAHRSMRDAWKAFIELYPNELANGDGYSVSQTNFIRFGGRPLNGGADYELNQEELDTLWTLARNHLLFIHSHHPMLYSLTICCFTQICLMWVKRN